MNARIFDLWHGYSGKGKSQALVELIIALHKETKKKARIYIGDGGVETYRNSGLVEEGILELVEYQDRDFPSSVVEAMVDLYMPQDPNDPKSKWIAPPPDLLASTHILVGFEGLAVMGKFIMGNNRGGYAYRYARGEEIGKDTEKDTPLKIRDEAIPGLGEARAFGGNTVGHYRLAQTFLLGALKRSRKFPGWVIWTTHPVEAADTTEGAKAGDFGKITGKRVVGPELVGKAFTSNLMREFGNTLHFDTATKASQRAIDEHTQKQVAQIDREYRIYTRSHFDPDGNDVVEYLAGNRCPIPAMMPDYLTDEDGERPGQSIVRFYRILKEAKDKQRELIRAA